MNKELIKYNLIVKYSKLFANNWEDLAHDTYLKLANKEIKYNHENELGYYIYLTTKSVYLNNIKREKYAPLLIDLVYEEDEPTRDPYELIQEIKRSEKIDEIEKLWLDTYLDHRTYLEIERNINVCRQTISKRIEEIIWKLSKD